MKQILFVLSVVTALVFLSSDICSARGRRVIFRRQFNSVSERVPQDGNTAARVYHSNAYDDYRERYPRYYGGFHARFFDNYGVPTGDVGVRGNGIHWTPW